MTLSPSELRAMRRQLATYTQDQLTAILNAKHTIMADCLDKCDDMLNDDHPMVIAYEKALTVHNCTMDEQDRRRAGRPIESLPGMDPLSASSHAMNGR